MSAGRSLRTHLPRSAPAGRRTRSPGPNSGGKLSPGADAELGVDALQVVPDRLGGEMKRRPDLSVGETLGGERGDAQFLRRELVRVGAATAAATARGRQLGTRQPGDPFRAGLFAQGQCIREWLGGGAGAGG